MVFGGFFRMLGCIQMVSMGYVSVMSRRFVLALFVMPGRFLVMMRRPFVMFGSLLMVLRTFMFRHMFVLP